MSNDDLVYLAAGALFMGIGIFGTWPEDGDVIFSFGLGMTVFLLGDILGDFLRSRGKSSK